MAGDVTTEEIFKPADYWECECGSTDFGIESEFTFIWLRCKNCLKVNMMAPEKAVLK